MFKKKKKKKKKKRGNIGSCPQVPVILPHKNQRFNFFCVYVYLNIFYRLKYLNIENITLVHFWKPKFR